MPQPTKVPVSKYQSSLLGGAIGDALGAPIEFMGIEEIRSKFGPAGVKDYVEFSDGRGVFTDDTQMTLFTAEALLRTYHRESQLGNGGALPIVAHRSYLRWLSTQEGPFSDKIKMNDGWLIQQPCLYQKRAPGTTCLAALRSGKAGSISAPINNSKGCGTIMRMAPVGLMIPGKNKSAFEMGCELSAITHGHPSGYLSGGFLASMISDLAVGSSLVESIEHARTILKTWKDHDETLRAVDGALDLFKKTKNNKQITVEIIETLGSGWVAEEALAISIYASLVHENDFEKGLLLAVNHTGDCDSTGSITGNILGLINGLENIPEQWIINLSDHELVLQIAEDLHVQVKRNLYDSDEEWSYKYPPG